MDQMKERKYPVGGENTPKNAYHIVPEWCTGCGKCAKNCPLGCIRPGAVYRIDRDRCVGCGSCAAACPAGAVKRRRQP